MSAGWLYYHKFPPRRTCPNCGKRHYLKRVGVMGNGVDVWRIVCPITKKSTLLPDDWGRIDLKERTT